MRLFLEVLRAVEYAHSNLILHRDLKPSNILVTREGRVKLLDFGIAKLLDERTQGAQPTELTQLAGRAFTPEYAAPEQIRGEDVTTATDVYALGVLLYRLLSGEHPTALATVAPVEQLRAVIEDEPARCRSPRHARCSARLQDHARTVTLPARALRGDLDNIVAQSAEEASARALCDGGRVRRRPEPLSEPRAGHCARRIRAATASRKFVQRHRLGVGAASATLLALIAGVIGTTWQAIEARRERDARYLSGRARVRQGQPGQPDAGSDRRCRPPADAARDPGAQRGADRETVHARSADRRRPAAADRRPVPNARRHRTRIRGHAARRRDRDRERRCGADCGRRVQHRSRPS